MQGEPRCFHLLQSLSCQVTLWGQREGSESHLELAKRAHSLVKEEFRVMKVEPLAKEVMGLATQADYLAKPEIGVGTQVNPQVKAEMGVAVMVPLV